jgi:hypothetical protein
MRAFIDSGLIASKSRTFLRCDFWLEAVFMRWLIAGVVFALSVLTAMADGLPSVVQRAISEQRRDCKTVAFEKGFVTRKDINGDGRPDFILDYGAFTCDGDRRSLCGSLGCSTQVFASLSDGTYLKVVDETVRKLTFREVQGRPAVVLGYSGVADGCKTDADDLCEVVKIWNGSTFATMAAAHAALQPGQPASPALTAGGAKPVEEAFVIHGQTFRLVPCSHEEGTAPASWKDVKNDLPREKLAKGSMTRSEALAALKAMAEAQNRKTNQEIFALYPKHRPISATNEEWSSIDEAEEKLGDIFYGNRAVQELGLWAASMQKEFRVSTALSCINDVLNPIVSAPLAPRP